MEKNSTRFMTQEEKEKFVDKIRIETEDCPKSLDGRQVLIETLASYNANMIEQIERINSAIPLHEQLKQIVTKQLENGTGRSKKVTDETLKTEINTRTEIINQMTKSKLLMQARLALSDKILKFCIENYEDIVDLDLYFGGGIGFNETQQKMEDIVNNNVVKQ